MKIELSADTLDFLGGLVHCAIQAHKDLGAEYPHHENINNAFTPWGHEEMLQLYNTLRTARDKA